ncbi:hypothetical protein ANCCAN_06046 [Ancylostoma caninum]|uniref:Uncharacterized protein n=1 Tax=Ancylostoma caninum TaxID=29170 RepID=A0A368GU05_ANCCA|nr:hypothetical protein ANCCAN_06046 [Ancylostoma caninum]
MLWLSRSGASREVAAFGIISIPYKYSSLRLFVNNLQRMSFYAILHSVTDAGKTPLNEKSIVDCSGTNSCGNFMDLRG